jgi:membrane-bound serine protease (ClpP class)
MATRALVVPLTGKLGSTEAARCHRALRQAEADGVAWVVFRLDDAGSQGEDRGDLQSLLDHVQQRRVGTVAVLKGRVRLGAAALALCCDRIYCLAGADWGEVTKPEGELDELLSDTPDAAQAARFDGERQAMASRLLRRDPKLRPDAEKLALAMADPREQLLVATVRDGGVERARVLTRAELATLQQGGGKVFGERVLPRPLTVTAQEAEDFGLAAAQLARFDLVADALAIEPEALRPLVANWAEDLVGWLELLQPFLLVAGLVFLLIEVKTPGVGIFGLLGVTLLGLALFHSYLVGLADVAEIVVFFLGLAAIAVEIFLLPGSMVFGIAGFLCLLIALVLSRQSFVWPTNSVEEAILLSNLANLTLLFLATLVLGGLAWRLLPKVPFLKGIFLPPPSPVGSGGAVGNPAADALLPFVGRNAIAVTVLRPAGTIEIDGERFDARTEGEFVEAGVALRVLYSLNSQLVVAADGSANNTSASKRRTGERGSVGVVVLLCMLGLALLFAEVVFVSMGVIGFLAFASLIAAIFVAFQVSTAFGTTMLIVEAIAAPLVAMLAFKVLPKTPFGRAMILAGPDAGGAATAAGDSNLQALLHKTGVTLSPLRPAGFARIDGKRIDVVTRGEMLPNDCEIVVLEVTTNRVVVGRPHTQIPAR